MHVVFTKKHVFCLIILISIRVSAINVTALKSFFIFIYFFVASWFQGLCLK